MVRRPVAERLDAGTHRVDRGRRSGAAVAGIDRVEFAHVLASPDYRAEAMRNAAVMRAEAATIAAMPGPVAC